jgi:hypothetical protein
MLAHSVGRGHGKKNVKDDWRPETIYISLITYLDLGSLFDLPEEHENAAAHQMEYIVEHHDPEYLKVRVREDIPGNVKRNPSAESECRRQAKAARKALQCPAPSGSALPRLEVVAELEVPSTRSQPEHPEHRGNSEHWSDTEGRSEESHMVKHWLSAHAELLEPPKFRMKVVGSFKDALYSRVW